MKELIKSEEYFILRRHFYYRVIEKSIDARNIKINNAI